MTEEFNFRFTEALQITSPSGQGSYTAVRAWVKWEGVRGPNYRIFIQAFHGRIDVGSGVVTFAKYLEPSVDTARPTLRVLSHSLADADLRELAEKAFWRRDGDELDLRFAPPPTDCFLQVSKGRGEPRVIRSVRLASAFLPACSEITYTSRRLSESNITTEFLDKHGNKTNPKDDDPERALAVRRDIASEARAVVKGVYSTFRNALD